MDQVMLKADVWDLTGRALRAAVDLGLHHDPETSGLQLLSALEVDLRRRLFWVYDDRVSGVVCR
jgi:hypothetical protein